MMRAAALVFFCILLVCLLIFLVCISVQGIRQYLASRRKREAERAARWEVRTDSDGQKVKLYVDKIARYKDAEEILRSTLIGTAYADRPDFEGKLMELQSEAYARALVLNSL